MGFKINNTIVSIQYYTEAIESFNNHMLDECIGLLDKSLQYDDENIPSLNLLGLVYYIKFDFFRAKEMWQRSLVISPTNFEAADKLTRIMELKSDGYFDMYYQAEELYEKEQYIECLQMIDKLIAIEPEVTDPYELQARCYFELELYNRAKRSLKKILALDAENRIARGLLNQLNMIKPQSANKSSVKSTTNASQTTTKPARLSKQSGKKSGTRTIKYKVAVGGLAVIMFIAMAVALCSSTNIAVIAETQNKLNEPVELALEEMDKTIDADNEPIIIDEEKISEETPVLADEEINTHEQPQISSNENNQAETLELTTEANQPEDDTVLYQIAFTLYNDGDYEQAAQVFADVYRNGKTDYLCREANFYAAVCFEKMGDVDSAVETYAVYIEDYEGTNYYDDALYNLGLLLYENGDNNEAAYYLCKLTTELPQSMFNNSIAHNVLGTVQA